MQFDESKHPRDKDGKFTDGNGTTKEAYDSRDAFGNMIRNMPQGAKERVAEISLRTDDEKLAYNKRKIKQLPALPSREQSIEQIAAYTGFSKENAALAYDTLKSYTRENYKRIRANPNCIEAKIIEEFISAHPKYDGVIYRGIGFYPEQGKRFLTDIQIKIKNNLPLDMDGISSWSDAESIAKDFADNRNQSEDSYRFVFVLNNKTGVGIDHISDWTGENEVIQSAKSTYTIKGIKQTENGRSPLYKIFLEEKEK